MSNIDHRPLLCAAIPAIADELSDLALEVAMLGESLSASHASQTAGSQAMQKFDAFSQALNAYARILNELIRDPDAQERDPSALLECIPFFQVRERMKAKIFSRAQFLEVADQPDDVWLEC